MKRRGGTWGVADTESIKSKKSLISGFSHRGYKYAMMKSNKYPR